MRYILQIILLTLTVSCFGQITDTQVKLRSTQTPDSIMVLSNDTASASPYYSLGKWMNLRDLGDAFGWNSGGPGGGANLTIGGSGPYSIDSDSGTDVGVDDLFGIILSESPANTLNIKADTSVLATPYDLTQIPISSLKAAIATNTINNANYNQEWQWNTLSSGTGLKLSSTSTAAASNTQRLFESSLSGANANASQTTVAGYFTNTHTGSNNINYGVYSLQTGSPSSAFPGAAVYGLGDFVGVQGFSSAGSTSSVGVQGDVTSGTGMYATATTGQPFKGRITAGTSGVDPLVVLQKFQSGSASTLTGGSIDMMVETSAGSADSLTSIIARWTDKTAGTRTGEFIIKLPNSATTGSKLILSGNGRFTLPDYGIGSFTAGTPTYNIVVDASGNLMEAAVPVGGLNVVEENNVTVQSANINIDFQNPFDVATDGASEVNISFDGGEFTTVTTAESDDYLLMHDSGSAANQKILWTDLHDEIITFYDGAVLQGTGNAIDVGNGLDINMVGSEANINYDMSELLLDGSPETDESFIVYDPDTTAGHRVQRIPWADVVGGSDTNFAEDDLTFTGNRSHDMDVYTLSLHGDVANVTIKDDNGSSGNNLILASELGAGTGITGGINFQSQNGGTPTEQYDIQANKIGTNQSTLSITANQATDADIVYEKNAAFADNTTESHYALNGGRAYTQNYEWTATSADLTLDRSYNIVNVSGSGAIGDEINLPEIASTSDNWDSALTTAQAQVGQEYTITNFRAATNLVVRVFSGDEIDGTGVTNVALVPHASLIVKAVRLSGGVGYWKTYD